MKNDDDQYPVDSQAMAKFLRERLDELGLSGRGLARKTEAGGPAYKISPATVCHALKGKWRFATPRTLRGLAYGLDVPEERLLAIARGKLTPESVTIEMRQIHLPDTLWAQLDKDARRCKRGTEQHLEALLAAYFGADVNIKADNLALFFPISTVDGKTNGQPKLNEESAAAGASVVPLKRRRRG